MATTTNKMLSVPTVGGEDGTWGTDLNNNTITPIDLMLGGTASIPLSASNYTLGTNSPTEVQDVQVKLNGALLTDITVSSANIGFYFVENSTTGAFKITWTADFGAGPIGAPFVIPQGARVLFISDAVAGARICNPIGAFGFGAGLRLDTNSALQVDFPTAVISADTTLVAASHMKQFFVTAASNLTVPKASTLFNGFGFYVYGAGGAGTLVPDPADSIQGGAAGANFIIANGGQAWVTTDGVSSWRAIYVPPAATTTPALPSASGLVVQNNAAGPSTQIDITYSQAVLTTSAGLGFFATGRTITINLTTNGVNGLDTGSRAASTWYYSYLISDGINVAGLASVSPTAPTLPTGYIYSMRVGAMLTDGSSNLRTFQQQGRRVTFTGTLQSFGTGSIAYNPLFPPTSESAFVLATCNAGSVVNVGDLAARNILQIGANLQNAISNTAIAQIPNITGGTTFILGNFGLGQAYGYLDRINAT